MTGLGGVPQPLAVSDSPQRRKAPPEGTQLAARSWQSLGPARGPALGRFGGHLAGVRGRREGRGPRRRPAVRSGSSARRPPPRGSGRERPPGRPSARKRVTEPRGGAGGSREEGLARGGKAPLDAAGGCCQSPACYQMYCLVCLYSTFPPNGSGEGE